jgi:hypothetical protein
MLSIPIAAHPASEAQAASGAAPGQDELEDDRIARRRICVCDQDGIPRCVRVHLWDWLAATLHAAAIRWPLPLPIPSAQLRTTCARNSTMSHSWPAMNTSSTDVWRKLQYAGAQAADGSGGCFR